MSKAKQSFSERFQALLTEYFNEGVKQGFERAQAMKKPSMPVMPQTSAAKVAKKVGKKASRKTANKPAT